MENYKSGNITHRNRVIPIVWNGEHAQHIAEEHIKDKGSHPLLHIRIQQLAKKVKEWKQAKVGSKRYEGNIFDNKTNQKFLIIVEIWGKFVYIITRYKI
jgi:hypothetical protein